GFEFDATQAQIADALGLTPVHVNRVMQALRKRGVIATAGRTIHILDWTTLAGLGEFESDYLELPSDQMRLSPAPDG
ncbi:MAG: helix-turn-helix domain-containing protein, partial [Sphingomonadales bacterium]